MQRINQRPKSAGPYLTEEELQETLQDAYDLALERAGLEAFEGRYESEELAAMVDQASIIELWLLTPPSPMPDFSLKPGTFLKPFLNRLGTYLLLSAIAFVMLLPLLWLVSTAFKAATEDIFQFPPQFIPAQPTLENFVKVWQTNPFGRYLFNSTLVALLTVGLNLLFCSLAAYPLARLDFRGKSAIFTLIVATILIPFQIVMIPLYILAVQLGLRNTYLGLIFPAIASAFGIFLLRQAFQGVPKELEEAARMDGCSDLEIWWHVMLPSIRPALVTLAIFVFIGSWSDFLWPLIILDRPEYYTLPLGVAKLAGAFSLDWRLIAAGSVISIAPILLFFILMQRYIVPTEAGSGVKG